jgi:uncharacterized protein YciI
VVADYFLVKRAHGPSWDTSRLRRDQEGWPEHAAFMDELVDEGVVVLGGPVGEGDGDYAVLVMEVKDAAEVRRRLADDPWGEDMLATESIEPWSVFLRRTPG